MNMTEKEELIKYLRVRLLRASALQARIETYHEVVKHINPLSPGTPCYVAISTYLVPLAEHCLEKAKECINEMNEILKELPDEGYIRSITSKGTPISRAKKGS